jgi:transcriptional regulator with XRE-family HTH domain
MDQGVGKVVKRLREERGWSQMRLAVEAKMSVSGVSLIENGHRNLSTATLAKLAEALDVEIADLFPKAEARLWSDDSPVEPGGLDLWAAAYAGLGEELARRAAEKLAFFAETDRGYIERTFGPQSKTAARLLWIRYEEWISEFSEEVVTFSAKARESQKAAHLEGRDPQLGLIGPIAEKLFALHSVTVDAGKQIARAAFEEDQDAESYERRFQDIVEAEQKAARSRESFERVLQQK